MVWGLCVSHYKRNIQCWHKITTVAILMWTSPQKARQRVNEELQSLQNNRWIWSLKLRLHKPSSFALITIHDSGGRSLYKLPLIHCMSTNCWDKRLIKNLKVNGEFMVVLQLYSVCLLWDFFLSFPYLHTNLWCVLFVSVVAGWITQDFWGEDDWCLLPVTCQFLQPGGTYSSCGFCCLPLKTQQYFAIVGQWKWKQSQRNLKTNSEHYGFANFVRLFSMHVLLLPCQDFLSAGSSLMCSRPICVYCLVSWCLSVCLWLTWASPGAHLLVLMLISSTTIKLFSKSSCRKFFTYVCIWTCGWQHFCFLMTCTA